jgi:hypothetical protein
MTRRTWIETIYKVNIWQVPYKSFGNLFSRWENRSLRLRLPIQFRTYFCTCSPKIDHPWEHLQTQSNSTQYSPNLTEVASKKWLRRNLSEDAPFWIACAESDHSVLRLLSIYPFGVQIWPPLCLRCFQNRCSNHGNSSKLPEAWDRWDALGTVTRRQVQCQLFSKADFMHWQQVQTGVTLWHVGK